MDCTSLEFVTVPDSVAAIAKNAFSNCTSLSKIVIGRSVHTIMEGAFDSAKIDTVYYRGGESEWNTLSDTFAEGTLADAEVLFFSESEPATAGNYWHYVDGVPTKW